MQFNWKNTRNFKLSSVFLKTLPRWTIQNKRSSIISPLKHQNLHLENNHILQKFPTSKTSPNFLQGCTEFTSNNTARSQTCTENEIYFQTQKNTTTYLWNIHLINQTNHLTHDLFICQIVKKENEFFFKNSIVQKPSENHSNHLLKPQFFYTIDSRNRTYR